MKPTPTIILLLTLASLPLAALAQKGQREAPPGMFKDLDDAILSDALVLHGKQLFIDDHVIGEMHGVEKKLNRPVKHPGNPVLRSDQPWEHLMSYGAVIHDPGDGLFKLWYTDWTADKNPVATTCYATSKDGISWQKPVINPQEGTNRVMFDPPEPYAGYAGVIIDPRERDASRRYKMLYSAKPTGKVSSIAVHLAYSADGIHWKQEPKNPLIPYSDTQIAPYWDAPRGRYVAYLRFGPPNIRLISRIESEDFLHWSPKVTVIGHRGTPQAGVVAAVNQLGAAKMATKSKLDEPLSTVFYGMAAMPYAGVHIGLLNTYHGETIQPIPEDKLWMDRKDVQLTFSRNGLTWQRVGRNGAFTAEDLHSDRDWKQEALDAAFISYGELHKDWDGGSIGCPHHAPLIVGDEIRFYYTAGIGRNWAKYHKDPDTHAVGLATLRLDGFVSVDAGNEPGTLTTKPLVFIGDTLEINANAAGGSLTVEALDAQGQPIPGFSAADGTPITTDSVRHVVRWKDNPDCQLLQARPIRLRFHLKNARLYAFEPRIRHNHYLQTKD
jgi:hypothetical protein